MIESLIGRPWDEVIYLADKHTMAVQGWLASRTPAGARFKGLGVSASASGLGVQFLNLALGGDFPPGTSGEVIEDEIEAVKTFFANRGVDWYWLLGPIPRPPDIGKRLERHGLTLDPPPLPALVAPLPARFPELDPDVQVWRATGRADLETASTIRRIAFRFPEGEALDYFQAMGDDWLNGASARLFLARLRDGPSAAIGALIMGVGLPGVYVMATLPEWSRRGLGKAILARILSEAAAEGHDMIVLTASNYGYPLYRQFGFEHVFDYALYGLSRQG
jgi:GNAT superfamily N-acetyltransferase